LYIEGETPEFFHVNIMHNRVELRKGVEAEEFEPPPTILVKEEEQDHFCILAFKR